MGAVPYSSQTVQSWNSEAGGEVAIRATANCDFFQLHPNLAPNSARQFEQLRYLPGAFQRRTVDAAAYLELALGIDGAQAEHFALHSCAIFLARDAEIDLGTGFSRDHVGSSPAANDAHVEGDAPLHVGEPRDGVNLMCKLDDGAVPFFEVQSCVGSMPCHF